MQDEPIAIGVIGLGLMGTKHARNLSELGADVVAGTDVDPDARRTFETEFGADAYEDFERMYDAAEPDAVVITTPNKFHEPAATAALDEDIAVLCEKPLAHSLASAERIADADARSDAFCMVGFKNRFGAASSVFKAYQRDGEFGEITAIEGAYVRRRGVPGLGSWFTNEEIAGGGALIDIGVHAIDYALYLADYPTVEEVTGVTRNTFISRDEYVDPDGWTGKWDTTAESGDVDDSATVLLRCERDLTISLEIAWAANRDPDESFVVRGTEGGARTNLLTESLEVYETDGRGRDHYRDTDLEFGDDTDKLYEEDEVFLEGVRTGERPATNRIEEALEVQRVIDGIYRSSAQGTSVRLDAETDALEPIAESD